MCIDFVIAGASPHLASKPIRRSPRRQTKSTSAPACVDQKFFKEAPGAPVMPLFSAAAMQLGSCHLVLVATAR